MGKLVLKIAGSEWKNASRDVRELHVCEALGMDVLVLAKGEPGDRMKPDTVQGFRVLRLGTKPLGAKVPKKLNQMASLLFWAGYAAKCDPDIISGHDIPGAFIGYLAACSMKKKPKLVYDCHEFEIERSGRRGKLAKFVVKHLERFLMKRCALSIMVNDSIAEKVQEIHRLSEKPVVVRNIPPLWQVDEAVCKAQRARFLQELSLPEDTFLLMYHGGVMKNRGVESLIEQVRRNPHTAGIVLGNGAEAYITDLKSLAEQAGVRNRVLFHPAVPQPELWKYVGAVDVGMVILQNVCVNHYYALPNKFFENIQSLTPVIGSAFPEIKKLIDRYRIGLTCDPADMDAMAECIETMRTDHDFYARCKENLQKAKADLNWEKERKVLENAYKVLV